MIILGPPSDPSAGAIASACVGLWVQTSVHEYYYHYYYCWLASIIHDLQVQSFEIFSSEVLSGRSVAAEIRVFSIHGTRKLVLHHFIKMVSPASLLYVALFNPPFHFYFELAKSKCLLFKDSFLYQCLLRSPTPALWRSGRPLRHLQLALQRKLHIITSAKYDN